MKRHRWTGCSNSNSSSRSFNSVKYKKERFAVIEIIHITDFINLIQNVAARRKKAVQNVFTVAMEAKPV